MYHLHSTSSEELSHVLAKLREQIFEDDCIFCENVVALRLTSILFLAQLFVELEY